MPRPHGVIAAMAGEGIVNLANQYAQKKQTEREQSRVRDLLKRLENATDAEKVSIYGELDPKLALGFEIANEKNKVKREGQQIVSEAYQEAGLGQAPQTTQNVSPQGTASQPAFSINGPSMAARNETKPNFNINQNAQQEPVAVAPQDGSQGNAPQQEQPLTPRQRAQAIRARAGQVAAINPAAAQGLLQEAKAIETESNLEKKFQHEISREAIKDEENIRKESAPYIEGVLNGYKGKKSTEAVLNQMEQLASSKELTTPLMNSLLGAAGLPLGVLNNPDSEEFEKLSNNLTRDITKFYGARINQTEFINFLKQIPTLNNSEEGRLRVISNLKKMLNPIELEYKIMSDMMAKNGGKPFPNMNFHVTQAMEPILDKWANEINHDLKDIKDVTTPLASNEVVMVFPDGSRKRVPKEEVGKWSQWGKLE